MMKPFINIASPRGNVVFNFTGNPIGDLTAYALGYRRAARVLADRFSGNAYADYDGYPVLYLYRHSLELYLKAVVYRGATLMGLIAKEHPKIPGLFKRHDFTHMLPAVRAIFQTMDWHLEGPQIGTFAEFERLLETLDSIDNGSYGFRYPINPAGEAHLPHHFTVNVANFAGTMDVLLDYLEGAADLLDDSFQAAAEASHEVEQFLADED